MLTCKYPGCNNKSTHRGGYCSQHYVLLLDTDVLPRVKNKQGAGNISPCGYRRITLNGKRDFEHRFVATLMLGRALLPGERVHHVDGNKLNNAPSNLRIHNSQADHLRHSHRSRPQLIKNIHSVIQSFKSLKNSGRWRRGNQYRPGTIKTCMLPGCTKPHATYGLCSTHGRYAIRHKLHLH